MKIILTLLTILILSGEANTQYVFDSIQVKKIRLVIEENEYLNTENDSLNSRIDLYKKSLVKSDLIISMQDTILQYKEKQIKLLEMKPMQVITVSSVKWYTYAGIIISSVCAGIITGLFIQR